MGRISRVVVPDAWHHVTQRGNHRQPVFLDDSHREFYLRLLADHCRRRHVAIGGYCLMTNHVHLLAIPANPIDLSRAIGRTHNDYARWIQMQRGEVGHLWQNRFYSCALDDDGRWDALRYIELNPVRAGIVPHADDWRWSSARAHLFDNDPAGILALDDWRGRWSTDTWHDALASSIADADLAACIRASTLTGRPLGSESFIRDVEARLGRTVAVKKRGRKPHAIAAAGAIGAIR